MTDVKEVSKQLQHLLREGKAENSHSLVLYIVCFTINKSGIDFVTCLANQRQIAFDFLRKKNVDSIVIERLTNVYNLPYLQK